MRSGFQGCVDAEDLKREFGRFRILSDARRSIENVTKKYPELETKVDVLFCERGTVEARRFAIMASLKVNRKAFLQDNVRQVFRSFAIDLGISVEKEKYRAVRFEEGVGVHVVYLPTDVTEVYARENATKIVERALIDRESNRIIRYFLVFSGERLPHTIGLIS